MNAQTSQRNMSITELEELIKKCPLEEEDSILNAIRRSGRESIYLGSTQKFESTFSFPKFRTPRFEKILKSQNNILAKVKGNKNISIVYETIEETIENNIEYIKVKISCEAYVKNPGFILRGYMRKREDGSFHIYSSDQGYEVKGITKDMDCFRCKEKRVRNIVYIFEKKYRQIKVGSSCIDEFIGTDVEKILSALNRIHEELTVVPTKEEIEKSEKLLGIPVERLLTAIKIAYSQNKQWIKKFSAAYCTNDIVTSKADGLSLIKMVTDNSSEVIKLQAKLTKEKLDLEMESEKFKELPSDESICHGLIKEFKDLDQKDKRNFNLFSSLFYIEDQKNISNPGLEGTRTILCRKLICKKNWSAWTWAAFRVINKITTRSETTPTDSKIIAHNYYSKHICEQGNTVTVLCSLEKKTLCKKGDSYYLKLKDVYGNIFDCFLETSEAEKFKENIIYLMDVEILEHKSFGYLKTNFCKIKSIRLTINN